MKFRTCPEFSRRYETLVKEDLDCSCAELVFGQTTGQLHHNISEPVTPPHQFLEKLKGYFDFVKPQQTTNHSNITIFVDKNLADCSHVWLGPTMREKVSFSSASLFWSISCFAT